MWIIGGSKDSYLLSLIDGCGIIWPCYSKIQNDE